MRLWVYVAVELLGGVTLLGGGALAAAAVMAQPEPRSTSPMIARPAPPPAPEPVTPPPSLPEVVPTAKPVAGLSVIPTTAELAALADVPEAWWVFVSGTPDETLLGPLRAGRLAKAKFNKGGSSISLRLTFADGSMAAFKPDQTNLQSVPRREVAAYRLARLLGMSNVAPAIPASFDRQELINALVPDSHALLPRFGAEVPANAEGQVTGSLQYWIPAIDLARYDGKVIDKNEGIRAWTRALTIGEPGEEPAFLAQLSDMLLFDFLTDNFDRFSGANTRSSPDNKLLYFMDNAAGFRLDREGRSKVRTLLERCQKFSRRSITALRALDRATLSAIMKGGAGPWGALLSEAEIEALWARRSWALAYVDALIAEFGEDKVLVYP